MKLLVRLIGKFFTLLWKIITFIRIALSNLIFVVVLGVIAFVIFQSDTPTEPVMQKSALRLNLSGPIVEQRSYASPLDSIAGSVFGNDMPKENVLFDVVDTIRHAKDDANITGIVLDLGKMPETNLTKLRYIAKALTEFKTSNKPIVAIGDFYNQSQYYLASYADKIYLSPDGGVLLKGYSAYSLYYKTLLEKLDINTHVFRVGTYKSAVEPFMRDDMSDASREAATQWLTQLWQAYVDDVSSNRHIDAQTLNPDASTFLAELKSVDGDIAALALKMKLVDTLATRQTIRSELAKQFGQDGKDNYKSISYYQYQVQITPETKQTENQIAVVVASGAIVDGKQSRGNVGAETTVQQLRQARNDEHVKAVVLRVDSPGGSAFASEVIRNEIQAVKDAGKPVVISMSSLAASGGYWISMNGDTIIAQPTTLTGSIGIFSVMTTFEKGLNKYGVYADGVGTSPFSGSGATRGLTPEASQAIQMGIEHGYHRFIGLVAKQRKMTVSDVDNIAQGRVWTGQDAMKRGLVDQMGDFDDALQTAAKLANIQTYNINWLKKPLSTSEQFVQQLFAQAHASLGLDLWSMIPQGLQPVSRQMLQDAQLMDNFNDPQGRYAFCLNCKVE